MNLGIWILVLAGVAGCSTVNKYLPDKTVEYQESASAPQLEIPPNLAAPETFDDMALPPAQGSAASYQDLAARPQPGASNQGVLVTPVGVTLQRDGDMRWLQVDAEPQALWPKLREFWLQQGLLIDIEEPRAGIMETDWAENRADIPQGPIQSLIGKVLDAAYSAATRDKYRTRLEQDQGVGGTQVYITHYGMKEVVVNDTNFQDVSTTVWEPRPSDPDLEAAMLARFMVFLGDDQARAQRALATAATQVESPKAHLVEAEDGTSALILDEGYSRGWRRVGLALDRVGFAVEDRDRSRGIYYVRYRDLAGDQEDEGFLSRLKFWGDDKPSEEKQYQIKIEAAAEGTRVTVLSEAGEPDSSAVAKRILSLLLEQLQ